MTDTLYCKVIIGKSKIGKEETCNIQHSTPNANAEGAELGSWALNVECSSAVQPGRTSTLPATSRERSRANARGASVSGTTESIAGFSLPFATHSSVASR